jgi:predicted nuclease of predicted toxin-antitoxin system
VRALAEGGYDILWVRSEAPGSSDPDVMKLAFRENRLILTHDKDFGELVVKENLCPSTGVILLRLPLKNPAHLAPYILDILKSRSDWEGHLSVIEEKRIRMRPLPSR